MCGIVGCVGHEGAVDFTVRGLEYLMPRGYDSAGLAFPDPEAVTGQPDILVPNPPRLRIVKALGEVLNLTPHLLPTDGKPTTAIGHTRWATHGKPTIPNTHPHTNKAGTIAVVHNGVIENHARLKKDLEADGYEFMSETDTEVVPHLIDRNLRDGQEPEEAFTNAIKLLEGAGAILVSRAEEPDALYAASTGGPLILGLNGSEHFAASETGVWIDKTKKGIPLDGGEMARISTSGYKIWKEGKNTTRQPVEMTEDEEKAEKGDNPNFMIKEIKEQPTVIRRALSGRIYHQVESEKLAVKLGGLENPEIGEMLKETDRIIITGCGTSYHSGLIGQRLIEELAGIPVEVELASELQYKNRPISPNTAILAMSQSGETMDTIAVIESMNQRGQLTLGINNSPTSRMTRITKAGIHCRAGKEMAVASTKAFTSQIVALAELAVLLSDDSNKLRQPLMQELLLIPDKIERILKDTSEIEAAAKKYAKASGFVFIGRNYEHATALEGALKLKEISYINANGYASGELKHGSLALIEENHPTFAIATDSPVLDKVMSNIAEVKARSGPVLALATEGNEKIKNIVDDVLYVPATMEQTQPILNAVALQLFAYYVALELDRNIDMPRNLAKTVTVE